MLWIIFIGFILWIILWNMGNQKDERKLFEDDYIG